MSDVAPPPLRVGIIGAGRMGRALGRALQGAGHELVAASSRSPRGRVDASETLGLPVGAAPAEVLHAADVVFLCVPDAAVSSVVGALAKELVPQRLVVLTSGSVPLAQLEPLRERGHRVLRMHPLRAVTHHTTPSELCGAPAAITATDEDDRTVGHRIARELGLVAFDLAEAGCVAWHAAATIAANHSVALVADARDLATRAGVDPGIALAGMAGLARQAIERAAHETPEAALTGPVARGDLPTIAAHLQLLGRDAPELLQAYRALASRAASLVPRDDDAIDELLDDAGPVLVQTTDELRGIVVPARDAGLRVGFVPTMGALHDGHAELVRAARRECDVVVVSCFVNPTQFGPGEDLDRYPRTPAVDEAVVRAAGGDVLWRPRVVDVYGDDPDAATSIRVGRVGRVLEGAARPGHFDGVASVVVRLLGAVQPHVLYLGAKDFQQVVVLRTVLRDLAIPVEVRVVDIVRDTDGLARSSRNAYLTAAERAAAGAIPESLDVARELLAAGERDAGTLRDAVRARLERDGALEVDYVEVVAPDTLARLEVVTDEAVVLVAARVGSTRLIDNARLAATRQEVLA